MALTRCKTFFMVVALTIASPLFSQNNTKPLVFGNSEVFHSDILKEDRNINIYLPEEFNPADATKYPVIYILDGGVEEDFSISQELYVIIHNHGLSVFQGLSL
ncbi:Predicted hydrolase of the alpha/beta superfamily [Elizabethkingia miricola]|nr:Predicted hydrolase of the alpha/beta superfamily [Elizabethkingia miricola]